MSIAIPSFFALPSIVGLEASKIVATNSSNQLASVPFPTVSGSALLSTDAGVFSWGKPWEGYLASISVTSPLSGAGTSGNPLTVDLSSKLGINAQAADSAKLEGYAASHFQAAGSYQTAHVNLSSLAGLTFASSSFVKMTADGTFGLDTTAYVSGTPWTGMGYLTSLSGAVLTSQATPQTIGSTSERLSKLWATDIACTNAISGSVTGNAGTVTNGVYTNAANVFSGVVNPLTTPAESWIGPSSTAGIYFKSGYIGLGGVTTPGYALDIMGSLKLRYGYSIYAASSTDTLFTVIAPFVNNIGNGVEINDSTASNTVINRNGGRVGVGTPVPLAKFTVLDQTGLTPRGILSMQITTDTNGARVGFSKARGTYSEPTTIVTGDTLGSLMFRGYDGTNYLEMGSIECISFGTIGTNRIPTYLKFSVSTNVAPSILTDMMWITPTGIGFGVSPTSPIHYVKADSSAMTDFLMNPTIKTSGNLHDWQVGSVSKASIDYTGMGTFAGGVKIATTALIGSPLAGILEFLSDKFYATITTGPTRKEIKLSDSYYAEAYFYTSTGGSPTAVAIDTTLLYHAISLSTTSNTINGFTHKAGTSAAIASIAENSAGVSYKVTTTGNHNLTAGDIVTHTGLSAHTSYRGKYIVQSTPSATEYVVLGTYVGTDTGFMKRGFSLKVNTGGAGVYRVGYSMSVTAASNTTELKVEVNKNISDVDNIACQRWYNTNGQTGNLISSGLVTLADGDIIWLSIANLTDATDYSIYHANLSIVRA